MKYEDQLNTCFWRDKKFDILLRDNNECQICMCKDDLHIHHKKYISGLMAWEYDDRFLITLCGRCHEIFHRENNTEKFLRRLEYEAYGMTSMEMYKLRTSKERSKN